MNAAFLLMTSAMFVGQGGDKKAEPIPPPAKTTAVASGCGQCGQDGFGLRDRLRSLFHRDCRDNCQPSCHDRQRISLFQSHCHNSCRPKIWNWQPHCLHQNRAPATCHDPCNRGGLNFLEVLRTKFHRGDRCCEGGTSGPVHKMDAPKQMPKVAPKGSDAKPQEVNNTPPSPIAPSVIPPAAPLTPNVESPLVPPTTPLTPIPPPREPDRRDPF